MLKKKECKKEDNIPVPGKEQKETSGSNLSATTSMAPAQAPGQGQIGEKPVKNIEIFNGNLMFLIRKDHCR